MGEVARWWMVERDGEAMMVLEWWKWASRILVLKVEGTKSIDLKSSHLPAVFSVRRHVTLLYLLLIGQWYELKRALSFAGISNRSRKERWLDAISRVVRDVLN